LKRTTGVRLTMLGKAILPSLLAASVAALAASVTASQVASPLAQLVTGLAVGGLVYVVAAAPQCAVWLSQEKVAKLRALRLFRLYDTAAHIAKRPASSEPEHGGQDGRHRARHAAGTRQTGSVAATPTQAAASEGKGSGRSRNLAIARRTTPLLRSAAQAVPFWRRPELAELLGWCGEPGHVAVRLVTGEGGAEKTRLAIELARVLRADGWQVLWVPPGAGAEAVREVRWIRRPAVLLVDYAETRTDILRLLAKAADDLGGPDLRVVLLARSAGEWWQKLIGSADYQLGEMLTATQPIRLRPSIIGPFSMKSPTRP
jgi:hypothetical protein